MIERACHAKINLALAVGPPIPPGLTGEGLHPVCSWVCRVGLADTLRMERLDRGPSTYTRRFEDGTPVDWPEDRDLAVRAHRSLGHPPDRLVPIELELVKRIPAGAGLGGGSADAGGVLMGIRELFTPPTPIGFLRERAFLLGCDVPFFVDEQPGPAVVSGLGERVERTPAMDLPVTLILPPFGCPTGAVYRAFDALRLAGDFEESTRRVREAAAAGRTDGLFNDLLPAAEAVRPQLRTLRERIERATGERVHLSGSGSTLFLIDPRVSPVELRRLAPDARVIATRTL
jgi:4-diphosphocytidyl-2-C-methyl-D-erythritol kinase